MSANMSCIDPGGMEHASIQGDNAAAQIDASPWDRMRQLLQEVGSLEEDVQKAVSEKCRLERENTELAGRVEVWVSIHTDAVVLGREDFLSRECQRRELASSYELAAAELTTAETQLQGVLEHNGMLQAELDVLNMLHKDMVCRRQETESAESQLRAVVDQLTHQIGALKDQRQNLLDETSRLQMQKSKTTEGDSSQSCRADESQTDALAEEVENLRNELTKEKADLDAVKLAGRGRIGGKYDWERERADLLDQLEELTRDSDRQRKEMAATLGQLVMEKQELLAQVELAGTSGKPADYKLHQV